MQCFRFLSPQCDAVMEFHKTNKMKIYKYHDENMMQILYTTLKHYVSKYLIFSRRKQSPVKNSTSQSNQKCQ